MQLPPRSASVAVCKRRKVPCHPTLESYLDGYMRAAGIAGENKGRLLCSMHKVDKLTAKPMSRFDSRVYRPRDPARRPPPGTCAWSGWKVRFGSIWLRG